MSDLQLSVREKRRYEKQIALDEIGESGQLALKGSRVLVIGAGGKGTVALKALITAGVGFVGVCDDSLIQEEILGRQSLFGDNDIGKQKAIVSKQFLQIRNQFTNIKVHNIRLTEENIEKLLENYDLVIDATFLTQTHILIYNFSKTLQRPVVMCFKKNRTPLITTLSFNDSESIEKLNSQIDEIEIPEDNSSPQVILNFLTGTLLAAESIKILLGQSTVLNNQILAIDAVNYSFSLFPKK